jgi:large subunit ribosomal protein L16
MIKRPQFKQDSFSKFRKSRVKGVTQPSNLKYNSVVGLQSCENAKLSSSVLYAVKRVLQQSIQRKSKILLLSFPHVGLTKKPSEVRMGKGRGSLSTFVARVRCGDMIYQLSNISVDEGVQALKKTQYKLGIKTRIIVRVQPAHAIKGSILVLLFFLFFII